MGLIELVIIATIFLCVLIAILIYMSNAYNSIKFITLPSAIAIGGFLILTVINLAGAPLARYPQGEFKYIAHQATNEGKDIVLWVFSERHKDYRLYRFPYNRETMKKLDEAQQSTQAGIRLKGQFKNEKKENNEDQSYIPYFAPEKPPTHNPLKSN